MALMRMYLRTSSYEVATYLARVGFTHGVVRTPIKQGSHRTDFESPESAPQNADAIFQRLLHRFVIGRTTSLNLAVDCYSNNIEAHLQVEKARRTVCTDSSPLSNVNLVSNPFESLFQKQISLKQCAKSTEAAPLRPRFMIHPCLLTATAKRQSRLFESCSFPKTSLLKSTGSPGE